MTATEVFFLFLRKGNLTPNERLALVREIRNKIYYNHRPLCMTHYGEEELKRLDLENTFVERLIKNTWYIPNHLGRGGLSSTCSTLSSFMKYLLYYVPSIIGSSREKNEYLKRENAVFENGIGYKRYWKDRFIKKWHDFINEYIEDRMFYGVPKNFKLKKQL